MPVQIQVRRGTAAQAASSNPVLLSGELGYETDTGKIKVGDGATSWNSLPYLMRAGKVVVSPSGNLSSTDVQAALLELQGDIDGINTSLAGAVPATRTVNGHALSADVTVTKGDVGLGSVPNVDATNPSNIAQDSTHRFATDAEKTAWNAKQAALGFTPEDVANKSTDSTLGGATPSDTLYPSQKAVSTALAAVTPSANSITNAKLAQMAANTIKGNNTGGTANASDLTASQVAAMLPALVGDSGSGGTKGLVPAPGAGDAAAGKVLKADGTWGPAGTTSPLTTKGDLYGFSTVNARIPVGADGQALVADSSTALGVSWADRPFGYPNLIKYSDAESGFGTWKQGTVTLSNQWPTTAPVDDGFLSTFNVTSTNPLSGTKSYQVTRLPAGSLYYQNFTVPRELLASVLTVEFSYEIATYANFVDGDISVAIRSNDGSSQGWIQPAPFKILKASGPQRFQAEFQTTSDGTSYTLAFFFPTTPGLWTGFNFDSLFVGRKAKTFGAPVTDWQSYTPTLGAGFGTPTGINFIYRRVGGSLEVHGTFTTGTVAASASSITIPSGLSVDTSKISAANQTVGSGNQDLATNSLLTVQYSTSTSMRLMNNAGQVLGNQITSSSTGVYVHFTVPILGWSSSTQMSDSASTRVIVEKMTFSGTQSVATTAATKVGLNISLISKAGGVDTANNRIKITVPGTYRVTASCYFNSVTGAQTLMVRKNGTTDILQTFRPLSNGDDIINGSAPFDFVAGDYLELWTTSADSAYSIIGNDSTTFLAVELIQGPSQIAASESVSARYSGIPTGAIAGTFASAGSITLPTKTYDTHGFYNGTTATIQSPGKYAIKGQIGISATFTAGHFGAVALVVNGVEVADYYTQVGGSQSIVYVPLADTYQFAAGDLVSFRVMTNGTSPSFVAAASVHRIVLERIGN